MNYISSKTYRMFIFYKTTIIGYDSITNMAI